jgi:hypothetical protein
MNIRFDSNRICRWDGPCDLFDGSKTARSALDWIHARMIQVRKDSVRTLALPTYVPVLPILLPTQTGDFWTSITQLLHQKARLALHHVLSFVHRTQKPSRGSDSSRNPMSRNLGYGSHGGFLQTLATHDRSTFPICGPTQVTHMSLYHSLLHPFPHLSIKSPLILF